MITITATLCLALALPGTPAEKSAPITDFSPASVAVSSTDQSKEVLANLTQFSAPMPVLAAPSPLVITPVKPVKRQAPVVVNTRNWLLMTAVQHSAATFDAWSTRASISSGRGRELNPLMKPFAGSGAIYGVMQLAPLATDYLGRRLMRSNHATLRKLWWLPQAAGSAGFMLSGVNNIRVASR